MERATSANAESLTVAVSIATHNRLPELERTLAKVSTLDPAPQEIWVAADGCVDGTGDWVREHYPEVHLVEFNPALGNIKARHHILQAHGCDLLLCLDDDSYPLEKDTLAQVRPYFVRHPNLGILSLLQRTDEYPETLEQEDFGPALWCARYSDSSAVMRARAVRETGGLSVDYWHVYNEPDVTLRLLAAGWDVLQVPQPLVRHHFTKLNRNEVRTHRYQALNEQLSLWKFCPFPYVVAVSKFRSLTQLLFARRLGWPIWKTEPVWWGWLAKAFLPNLKKRRPLSWPTYWGWMLTVRQPLRTESAWRRRQRRMRVEVPAQERLSNGGSKDQDVEVAFAATNPCHVYDLALELNSRGALSAYLSGYPRWKLAESSGMPIRSKAGPTLATYGLLKLAPRWAASVQRELFAWQDQQFDDWAAKQVASLERTDFLHGLPGQCAATFAAAKSRGIKTVLNHASGPVAIQERLVAEEFRAAGLQAPSASHDPDEAAATLRQQEYEWADFHLAASQVVKRQLIESGVEAEKIGVVPYGADGEIFYRAPQAPDAFQVLFAGTLCLRKGLRYLFTALEQASEPDWNVKLAGHVLPEAQPFLQAFRPRCCVEQTGPVGQGTLAIWMRQSSVLVLPSVEEAFGLVVVQALSSGLPCIVSDRVGAGDLIVHRENGSIVPFGDVEALIEELRWWQQNPVRVTGDYGWTQPTDAVLDWSRLCLAKGHEEGMIPA